MQNILVSDKKYFVGHWFGISALCCRWGRAGQSCTTYCPGARREGNTAKEARTGVAQCLKCVVVFLQGAPFKLYAAHYSSVPLFNWIRTNFYLDYIWLYLWLTGTVKRPCYGTTDSNRLRSIQMQVHACIQDGRPAATLKSGLIVSATRLWLVDLSW